MSAAYNTRIIGKLTDLANLLSTNNYRNEAGAIRTLIGKISNWKEGSEWNTDNPIMTPDADHVLEDMISKFKMTMIEAKKKENQYKREQEKEEESPMEESPQEDMLEKAMQELEDIL